MKPVICSTLLLIALMFQVSNSLCALDTDILPEVIYHPSGISYWSTPYFADAMMQGNSWMIYEEGDWGSRVESWNQPGFNSDGYPTEMVDGYHYRCIVYGLHTNYGNRPASWPTLSDPARGKVTLSWKGEADIRLNSSGDFLVTDSNGSETGLLVDGRRTYLFSGNAHVEWLEIHDINSSNPITDIDVWLPDPDDPTNATLEGQIFHPTFLERLGDTNWGVVRFMDWSVTNANPQRDWSDRRLPDYAFMDGVLNPRRPSSTADGNRGSGVAWEYIVALANETDLDIWVNVPHMATDDYITKLAQLIRFGSNGIEPYTSVQTDPVWPPLEQGRRVYLEYSNEIWSSGHSFPQGNWAQEQADSQAISKPQFNARRFCEVFQIFQQVFGGANDLVRVAAVFTAHESYTQSFLEEMNAYGSTLTPAVEPDVIAVTTYFGNGIQDWAHNTAISKAGTADSWFYTQEEFDAGGGNMHPVTISPDDPYWASDTLQRHLNETFDEWSYRMLSGDAREGVGPDAVGIGGGFGEAVREMAQTIFDTPKPIVAYEGGPSLYTDGYDWGDSRDDGITIFLEAMNRHPRMEEVYRIHLNMAKARGLWSHSMFTDSGRWGKYGQWGHLEYLAQPPADSPKYQFLLDWIDEQENLRHVDDPQGNVPIFDTEHNLPVAVYNTPYSADITVSGGEGVLSVTPIGTSFRQGLTLDLLPGDPNRVRITGIPREGGRSFVYLKVSDTDGDTSWRTFTIRSVGGPETILEADFTGSNPSRNTPWTSTYILNDNIAYTGVLNGSGIVPQDGDNAFTFSVNAPANEVDSTLAQASQTTNTLPLPSHPMKTTG